jgi:threonine dehydrogenase-like Zn-dependent dehydrogenase
VDGDIDPSFVITHRLHLADAAAGYETFKTDKNECIKTVMKPELN